MATILGLDIGIASLGWGYIDTANTKIIAAGVRTFTKAETPDQGKSLAEPRRLARSARRRLRRRRIRMQNIRQLFVTHDLLSQSEVDNLYAKPLSKTPWQLRAEGLDNLLRPREFAIALIHIAKRRGFKSNRKSELQDKDIGKLLSGVASNAERLQEKNYRSIGEMFYKDEYFSGQKRNKASDYSHTVARSMLEDEVKRLFAEQRKFGLKAATAKFEEHYLENMLWQLSFDHGDNILKMIGKCRFETEEYRAPKNSYSGERFVLWSKLNNLTLNTLEGSKHLTLSEMRDIEGLAYKNSKVTYKQIRKLLSIDQALTFVGLRYTQEDGKDPENTTFIEMKSFHEIRKKVETVSKQHWNELSKDIKKLDSISVTLSRYKTDENIKLDFKKNEIKPELYDVLSELSYSKHLNLSIKAIHKLLPFMEQGKRYDEVCKLVGYEHRRSQVKTKYLPVIDKDELRNPVVIRALTQARKLINAIIREHGSPQRVHIELSRELSKNFKDRKDIQKKQKEFRSQKEHAKKQFIENNGFEPSGFDLLKQRLHKQQNGFCIYSGEYMDPARLTEAGYVEVDHILPYSRSNDNSLNNKILCLTKENQQKGNAIPFEFYEKRYGPDSEQWRLFLDRCKTIPFSKRQRLMRIKFTEEDAQGFKERNLNDTRYIARYLKNFISDHLELASSEYKVPIQTNNGALTSLLRARWGLLKDRDENDLHHAVDALIVAGSTPSMIKRISDYHRRKELFAHNAVHIPVQEIIDRETGEIVKSVYREVAKEHFPQPWEGYREEIIQYVNNEIFVSRMPNRKVTGSAHDATIRSAKYLDEDFSIVKTPITSLTLKNLESLHDKHRSMGLYSTLKKRLEEHGGKAKKAFAEPLYMPTKSGINGPVIRSVKLQTTQKTGVEVNAGIANNGDMVRVDVFTKNKKYFLVPIYVADMVKGNLPNKAIIAHKSEEDWLEMDDTYAFIFSIFPNDLIEVKKESKFKYFGYFKGAHRGAGSINIEAPDRGWNKEGVGVKTLDKFQKYQVDLLGNYFVVKKEKRQGGMA